MRQTEASMWALFPSPLSTVLLPGTKPLDNPVSEVEMLPLSCIFQWLVSPNLTDAVQC